MSSRRLGPAPGIRRANPPNLSKVLVGYKESPEGSNALLKGRDPVRNPNDVRNRPASRIPQNPGTRRPSNPDQPTRPVLNHQSQSWSSAGSASARSRSNQGSSGSATSSRELDPRPTPALRRKRSNLTQNPQGVEHHPRSNSGRTSSSSSNPSRPQRSTDRPIGTQYDRVMTESPTEIRVAKAVDIAEPTVQTATIYPELDRYRSPQTSADSSGLGILHQLTTYDLPPPTPGYFSGTGSQLSTMSGSPSTRFSGSPGPGAYSRDTTPTSMSSQSPGLAVPIRFVSPRSQHGSPGRTRPPVTRRRGGSLSNGTEAHDDGLEGLATVRESPTSSSSNSTVRGTDKKKAQKKARVPPSSPPPRKSSANQAAKVRSPEPASQKISRRPTHPARTAAVPPADGRVASHVHVSPRAAPPVRPSRNGTPDMQSQLWEPVPVIHSNLSSTSLPGERRGSEPHVGSSSLPRSTTPSGHSDRARPTHRRQPSGQERVPISRNDSGGETAITKTARAERERNRLVRTPSPNVSTFNSRFNFFGRKKSVPTPETAPASKQDRPARKGPAAGTGHEGYGRMGAIRRRSSGVLNPAGAHATSTPPQDNLANKPQFSDPFLRERMNPVVISGGEVIENQNTDSLELSCPASSHGFTPGHTRQRSNDSKTSSASTTSSSRETNRKAPWTSPFLSGQKAGSRSRRPSESSDDGPATKPTLAFRRSVQKLRTSPEQGPVRLPKPINTRGTAASPLTSFDTNTTIEDSNAALQRERSREKTTDLMQPKKLTKRSRSPRKWNFFSRSQPQAKALASPAVEEVAAVVNVVQTRQIPYYAMMDSSEMEDEGDMDVMDVLRSAQVCDAASPQLQETEAARPWTTSLPDSAPPAPATARRDTRPTSPLSAAEPEIYISPPTRPSSRGQTTRSVRPARPAKPSRLPQVGRIPKVVSTRPEQASSRSFSRPFNRASPRIPTTIADEPALEAPLMMSPSPPKLSTPELGLRGSISTGGSGETTTSPALIGEGREFLAFSPRKNSTTTTSSSSCYSGIGTMVDTTAVIPSPSAPLAEDEIWDEYNDLLGDVSLKPPLPAALRKVAAADTKKGSVRDESPESPTIAVKFPRVGLDKGKRREEITSPPSVYSCDEYSCDDLMDSFRPSYVEVSPATPFSVSQFVAGYSDRNNSAVDLGSVPADNPRPSGERNSGSSSRKSRTSCSSGGSKTSDEETPLAQVNIRVGSMTVSKWLTFGHVLFSPAREELAAGEGGSRESHSVLVIDGLGNDDWSFYAAETYPGATFFNLSPRAPLPEDRRKSTAFPLSPANHYQIQYNSHLTKFPFGPATFSTVVIRFPAAAPQSHYNNLVSEARRVLQAGGYVELSILDVDLNNMGDRGRRAVRRLKERVHARSADTNLASTADVMLRLLGRKNFVDIKSCRVGIPVASSVAPGKVDRVSSTTATPGEVPSSDGVVGKGKGRRGRGKEQRSLAEMMNDDSELADESIAKMVSKVGRWWYTRCYESAAALPVPGAVVGAPGQKRSIWDRALLAECEERGTSLKLMVCHARVPEGSRVASI